MSVILNEAKFPVIAPKPTFQQTVNNFTSDEYKALFGGTIASLPLGYYLGHKCHLPRPSMWLTATLASTFIFTYALQQSAGRLMGLLPNEREVAQYNPDGAGVSGL